MRTGVLVLGIAAAACPLPALQAQTAGAPSTERHSLRFAPGGERSLEIDTVWGDIDVTTWDGATVEVTVTRTVEADDAADRAAADRDVRLEVTNDAPTLRLYVDGPFRDWDDSGFRRGPRIDYAVHYDFTVRVPKQVAVRLKTVNEGEIRVRGLEGAFDVRNVNGAIALDDIAGAGTARTVNGDVRATFRTNPRADVKLKTLNGDVVARFGNGLAADVWLATVNGEAWTDYDYSALPPRTSQVQQRGSKRVWKIGSRSGIRIGAGGPSFDFETMNGDIRILRRAS